MHLVWEGVPGLEGLPCLGEVYLVGGGTWSQGVHLVPGGEPGPGGVPGQVFPPVDRITDTCKNITLPQLRCER